MGNYKAIEEQSLLDVAIQKSGSILAAFDLAVKNGLSVTDDVLPGQTLEMVPVQNADMVAYWEHNNVQPITWGSEDALDIDRIFGEELPLEFA